MNVKTVLPLFVCLALTLHAPAANGQYTPRPGGPGAAPVAEQGNEGNPAGLGLAFVTHLSGESLLRSTDDEDWDALSPNLSLRIGDRVWAQDGAKIEIRFPLGATAWVNYQSELDITRLESGSRGDTIQLALVSGEAAFDVKGFARPGSVFQVDIPNASIRASRAARFRVNTLPDGTAQIGVISGSLVLETPDGLTDVSGGQMAEVQPDQRVLLDFLPASDEWDDWVRSRAEIYDRPAASGRYLPADLSPYAHEFDTSGRWVSDPTYGSVWVPAVEQGWSPYSNGRWVWQAQRLRLAVVRPLVRPVPLRQVELGCSPSAGSGSSRGGGPTGRRAMSAGRSSGTRSPGCPSGTTRSTTGTGITAPAT